MRKIVRLSESDLVRLIKKTINEQGILFGTSAPKLEPKAISWQFQDEHARRMGYWEQTDSDAEKVISTLFSDCKKIADNQLQLNDSGIIQKYNKLYNQIQGVSNPNNTSKILQEIKTKNEFCAVARLFQINKKQSLYNELKSEWGLGWKTIAKSLSFLGFTGKIPYNQLGA